MRNKPKNAKKSGRKKPMDYAWNIKDNALNSVVGHLSEGTLS